MPSFTTKYTDGTVRLNYEDKVLELPVKHGVVIYKEKACMSPSAILKQWLGWYYSRKVKVNVLVDGKWMRWTREGIVLPPTTPPTTPPPTPTPTPPATPPTPTPPATPPRKTYCDASTQTDNDDARSEMSCQTDESDSDPPRTLVLTRNPYVPPPLPPTIIVPRRSVLCDRWRMGNCHYSNHHCLYAHGREYLGVPFPAELAQKIPCRRWKQGRCPYSDDECYYLHAR